jgi:Ca2+-binding EF-hand superfamily protein
MCMCTLKCARGDSPHPWQLREGIDKAIASMDKNGDGFVSQAELEAFMREKDGNLQFIEQMVAQLDADGDGQISKDEFKALAY